MAPSSTPSKTPVATVPLQDSDLVISGAGSHGLTEAAVLRRLTRVIRFRRVGGTSAGAINAAGLAYGFTPAYMVEVWRKLLIRGDLEDWKLPGPLKYLGLFQGNGGCIRGNVIREALKDVFGDARMGDSQLPLRIKVAGLSRRRIETVYSDLKEHKHLRVVDAVMCSLAVPFVVDNQMLDPDSATPSLYCDGGIGNNVPRALWDDGAAGRPTTVLRFADNEDIRKITKLRSRISAYFNIMRDAAEDERSTKPHAQIWEVPIEVTGEALDFSLDKAECDRREKLGDDVGRKWISDNTPPP